MSSPIDELIEAGFPDEADVTAAKNNLAVTSAVLADAQMALDLANTTVKFDV